MENKTDKELYQEFLQGNKESFDKIALMYKNQIIYFIQKYVRDINTAEDLAQDVFVYLLIKKENYKFEYSLKTYLYTIAKSKALNYIKRERKIIELNESHVEDIDKLEEEILRNERITNLNNTIKTLKPEYQNILYLIDIEGFSYKETAHILKKTDTNIKVLIHRARKALEKNVKKEAYKYER